MPRLSQKCVKDVKRYISLRYDHLGEVWIKSRIEQVIKALKKESKEAQGLYSKKVADFFEINKDVIADAKKAKVELEQPVDNMLSMPREQAIKIVQKHGGNVNLAMAEINGYYH